jgi:hypothetical protein
MLDLASGGAERGFDMAPMELTVAIDGDEGSDHGDVERLTAQLRRQLLELDVDDVALVRGGDVPPGAKPVDPVTLGALAVTLGPALLQAVVGLVETWTRSRPVRSVKMTIGGDSIELTGNDEQHDELVRMFVARHAVAGA